MGRVLGKGRLVAKNRGVHGSQDDKVLLIFILAKKTSEPGE